MSSRQLRKQRRAAARRQSTLEPASASLTPPAAPSLHSGINPELLDEFTPEFMAEANRARAAVHARAGLVPAAPRRCTGPTTENGKRISSRNSLKHGLASGALIIAGEQPADFEALLADLLAEHQPASPTEELLVRQIAQSFWLSQRALRLQTACFSDTGVVDAHQFALLLRYQTAHERTFHRALATLTRLKKERVSNGVAGSAATVPTSPVPPSPSPRTDECPRPVPRENFPDRCQFVSQNTPSVLPATGSVSQNAQFVPSRTAGFERQIGRIGEKDDR